VTVTVDEKDGILRISVEDTGIGFTPEESARLFEEFGRIRNEKTQDILGSGLGLSIVKKIASVYKGEAGAVSRPDQGSVFTVLLPLIEPGDEPGEGS